MGAGEMSPGEVMMLLDPKGAKAGEALKATVMGLVAKGALRIERRGSKGVFGRIKQTTHIAIGPTGSAAWPGPGQAVVEVVGQFGSAGAPMQDAVAKLRANFGAQLDGFMTKQVLPALVARGLMEPRRERMLGFIPVTRHHLTPQGEAERARIQGLMEQARQLPEFMAKKPAQALSLVAALGGAVFLLAELRPHLAGLGDLANPLAAAGFETDLGPDAAASFPDLGDLDFGAFADLDASLGDFDAGFGGSDGGGGGD